MDGSAPKNTDAPHANNQQGKGLELYLSKEK
jgi:hypothetical protein